jgi:hypothetical protein
MEFPARITAESPAEEADLFGAAKLMSYPEAWLVDD